MMRDILHADIDELAGGLGRRIMDAAPAAREKRPRKRAPVSMLVAGLGGLLVASMYLYRLFLLMPSVSVSADMREATAIMAMMIVSFVLYAVYITNVFRLSSGSRRAWASIERMSLSYILLTVLSVYGPIDFFVMDAWGLPSWALAVYMACLSAYMMMPSVRRFFTPGYADGEAGAMQWLMLILGVDPFKGKRQHIR
jgi:hypothetical protein